MIVFDASGNCRRGQNEERYRGLIVRFAQQYPDADTLLEQLIAQHTSPKQLTVVSSDHRVQRAAHHRRAKFIDSEKWYAQLCRRLRAARQAAKQEGTDVAREGEDTLNAAEVSDWLRAFGLSPQDAASPLSSAAGATSASKSNEGHRNAPPRAKDETALEAASEESSRSELAAPQTASKQEGLAGTGQLEDAPPLTCPAPRGAMLEDLGLSKEDLEKPIDAWDGDVAADDRDSRGPRKRPRRPRR